MCQKFWPARTILTWTVGPPVLVRSAAAICERFRRQRQFHSQPGLMLGPAPGRYRGGRIAKSAVCFGKRTYRDKSSEGESESERL